MQNLLDPQDLAEAKQEGLRKKIEDQRVDINELPALPEGAIDAIRVAGMELKIERLSDERQEASTSSVICTEILLLLNVGE